MHPSTLFAAATLALSSFAAPAPQSDRGSRRLPGIGFAPRQANTSCDLSTVEQPANDLTPPTPDLSLVLIALGRGTQNYTCATPTSKPTAIGALAELYNASCTVAGSPSGRGGGQIEDGAGVIGMHFFFDSTTPEFDVVGMGSTLLKKTEDVTAPDPTQDVPWLLLEAQEEISSSTVKKIYRLNTVGGLAPSSCEGVAEGETVTVEYEAQYWMYASVLDAQATKRKRVLTV